MSLSEPSSGVVRSLPEFADQVVAAVLDTLSLGRQCLVFVNTKRGAESQAEKIARKLPIIDSLSSLSKEVLGVLSSPTRQCKRLAFCLERGVAFHHSGLHSRQRALVEDAFRQGLVKVICATPTLAVGMDLPAFRVIIRDVKRYSFRGMSFIPVLEFEQMAGRAGRPGKDPWGEALVVVKDAVSAEEVSELYLNGEPEPLFSKLAVEPVLRTYVLSLVASGFVGSVSELRSFLAATFYAHQYGDIDSLFSIIDKVVSQLVDWGFLLFADSGSRRSVSDSVSSLSDDFVSASSLKSSSSDSLSATPLGRRVSELYLDPFTAHQLVKGFLRSKTVLFDSFSLLHLCSSSLELRPFLRVKASEFDRFNEKLAVVEDSLLFLPPNSFVSEFEDFLATVKTASLFEAWINESSEDEIMESFGVTPGELHSKLEVLDWIVHSASEIASLLSFHKVRSELLKLRVRLKHGAKEELLPLLRLSGVGRVRARLLFRNGVRSVADIKRIDPSSLAQLVGRSLAVKLKEQVGLVVDPEKVVVKDSKRKGQTSIGHFTK